MRVRDETSQLDLPSLTPLSVAGCGRLQLGIPHCATSVDQCKQLIIDPTFCGSRFSTGRLLSIENFTFSYLILIEFSIIESVIQLKCGCWQTCRSAVTSDKNDIIIFQCVCKIMIRFQMPLIQERNMNERNTVFDTGTLDWSKVAVNRWLLP